MVAAEQECMTISAARRGIGPMLPDVFRWSSGLWVLGLLTLMTLIDGGCNCANIERSEAVRSQARAACFSLLSELLRKMRCHDRMCDKLRLTFLRWECVGWRYVEHNA